MSPLGKSAGYMGEISKECEERGDGRGLAPRRSMLADMMGLKLWPLAVVVVDKGPGASLAPKGALKRGCAISYLILPFSHHFHLQLQAKV